MSRVPAAFISYARSNDQHENNRLTEFRKRLSGEVGLQTGEDFPIFQDNEEIGLREQWQKRIDKSLDAVTFLIPILTPGFFRSQACRAELERFLEREFQLGRQDLILPVYYVDSPILNDAGRRETDPLAKIIATRQRADWREFRFEPFTSPQVGKMIASMAQQIVQSLERADEARSVSTTAPPPATRKEASAPERGPSGKNEPPTRIVDVLHRGDHTTLTEALEAAEPGDRILIRPGLYREGVVVDKPVEIIGDGEVGEVVIEANGKDAVLFQANLARIANLTLRQTGGGDWYCVDIAQGRLDLEGCDITSQGLACVGIHDGADPRLRRNRIHDGKSSGVFVHANGQGTLEDNEIFANALSGVEITEGSNPTLRRNRIYDGKQSGVFSYANGQGTLEDNDIFANAYAGVEIREGGNPIVRRNRIRDGKENGVLVQANGQGTLEDNDIFANAYAGVEIREGGNPTLRRNRVHDGKGSGVFVHTNGLGTLEDNEIYGNGNAGVTIEEGGNPTLRHNRISKNGYEAIWVHGGGGGVFEDNDLRGNTRGAWDIAKDCEAKVTRKDNQE
jgi:F-box protein 11